MKTISLTLLLSASFGLAHLRAASQTSSEPPQQHLTPNSGFGGYWFSDDAGGKTNTRQMGDLVIVDFTTGTPKPSPTPTPTPSSPPLPLSEQTIPDSSFVPKYEIGGQWSDGGDTFVNIYRIAKQVVFIFNKDGYEQFFEGSYTGDQRIEGIQIRRKKSDNTIVLMRVALTVTSPDSAAVHWTSLDSNSDLRMGQTGTATFRRVSASEPSLQRASTFSNPLSLASPTLSEQTIPDPNFVPKYDFAGHWTTGSAEYNDTLRIGRHVVSIYNDAGYEHLFEGDYSDDHTILGTQIRRKRADGSITLMRLTITLSSPDLALVQWVALDSNSDLSKGQTGTVMDRRVPVPQASPLPTQPSFSSPSTPPWNFQEQSIPDPSFVPKYDFAGKWTCDNSPEHADVSRIGKHVVWIFNSAGYEHIFEGDYLDDHTIEGIQLRRKRSDGSITLMHQTLTLLSSDSGLFHWTALDSNSDLSKGQTGSATLKRVISSTGYKHHKSQGISSGALIPRL